VQKVIATKELQYRGRRILAGEAFDIDDEHIAPFGRLGWIRAPEQPKRETLRLPKQQYRTRVMRAKA